MALGSFIVNVINLTVDIPLGTDIKPSDSRNPNMVLALVKSQTSWRGLVGYLVNSGYIRNDCSVYCSSFCQV